MSETKIPADLGIKLGNFEEKAWTDILKQGEERLRQLKREIIISEALISLAKDRISIEKENFK